MEPGGGGGGGQIMSHMLMKDKTSVGFSVHKRVMETCRVPRIILLVNT